MVTFSDYLHKERYFRENFTKLQEEFIREIIKFSQKIRNYGFLHSTPIVVGEKDNRRFSDFYATLMGAVEKVVLNYQKDKDIQKIIALSDRAKKIISLCKSSYELGSLRPDFLIDSKGDFKINEINARFPLNGFFVTYYMNLAMSLSKRLGGKQLFTLPENSAIPGFFSGLRGIISTIKLSEPNWDVSLFNEYLAQDGRAMEFVLPDKLQVRDFKISVSGRYLESLILQLKQEEILSELPLCTIKAIQKHQYLNDLRTILIAHDKRLLDVLGREKIMSKYVKKEEMGKIRKHLIETHAINYNPNILHRVYSQKDDWVLKHAFEGKGYKVFIGRQMNYNDWELACVNSLKEPFVAQRFIESKNFSICLPHLSNVKANLEGMLLGVNGKFISQGVFRAKYRDDTSLSEGHVFVMPAYSRE